MDIVGLVFSSFWYILPAYIANATACIFGGGTPLDLGRNFIDGRRLIGNGVTFRGTFSGILCGTIAAILQGVILNLKIINTPMVFYSNIFECAFLGFLLSSGALFGDMVGSFIKRRLEIKQGNPAPILDQLNFVFGAILFTYPFSPLPLNMIITICVITPIIHLTSNIIAYKLKIKKVWW
ncbi:CDP-2,3-bis-(O-geranylgeranyl)-sn-glycerol synthase [Methanotorris formicicus]|uniref:CDP-archaeol synthase n=1 Tax=Methanotorris formicicus Mc-S-70 TaxID=647171 RepID=H1KWJ9_9EURY|nr:CDP-2,3-bis-(O-geranylgeranyl)-sn-glycerol synthase [Methanotorris formicicus]EHP89576.1 protein of unknown function DUF46 [Methanotorris formicicus Mc-S-70]